MQKKNEKKDAEQTTQSQSESFEGGKQWFSTYVRPEFVMDKSNIKIDENHDIQHDSCIVSELWDDNTEIDKNYVGW